jgi:hypothetical protein
MRSTCPDGSCRCLRGLPRTDSRFKVADSRLEWPEAMNSVVEMGSNWLVHPCESKVPGLLPSSNLARE